MATKTKTTPTRTRTRRWTCSGCEVTVRYAAGNKTAPRRPEGWTKRGGNWLCLHCQREKAVDTDYDDYHKPDTLIFQADFGPNETKTFTLTSGAKREYSKEDFRAYGRFVRERFDDFAWENDRIAHRTYGKALITWKGEPLTSSAIDIWSKRTEKLVINDWYICLLYTSDAADD